MTDHRLPLDDPSIFANVFGFMGLPLSRQLDDERNGAVIMGVPYDLGTSGRSGARFGPLAMRRASANLAWEVQRWPWNFKLSERLAAIGEFSAKIVHEVRSPLSTMMMALDHLHQLELPQTSKRRLTLAQEEAGRLNRLLGEILSYATPGAGRREWVDVNALVQQTVAAFNDAANGRFGAQRISCRCDIGRPGVTANPDKLRQLLINLLSNACDASPVGTEVTIETREVDAQGMMGICISNHAGDIRLECDLMSEPFYSTKPQGTGLGLAIVKGIVDALQGSFSIVQELTGRVTVLVMLPASAEGTDAASIDAESCHREQSLRGISCVAT